MHAYTIYPVSRDSEDLVFRLASPVISASFQCDTCTTSNLSTPVQVTFKHAAYDQVYYLLKIIMANCMNACIHGTHSVMIAIIHPYYYLDFYNCRDAIHWKPSRNNL